jgi:glutaredoxin
MDHVSVTMYGTRWCPVCAKARAWMSSNGYHFNELDVDANESAKEARDRLAPKGGVPVFLIGGQLLDGFSPGAFEQTLRRAAEKQLRR